MTWKLWLDDQLNDPETPARHTPEGFKGAESSIKAYFLLKGLGLPSFMDLDHDLGGDDTVMKFLNQMVSMFPDGPVPDYAIHSQNPLAGPNITAYLESWKRSLVEDDRSKGPTDQDVDLITCRFSLTASQMHKIGVFRDIHRGIHSKNVGAIGGRFTFEFTPTSLGTVQRCSCACGESIDVSNYDDW